MYRPPSQSSLMKGKFFFFLSTLLVFAITVFLARNFILVKSVDIALQSMFPKSKAHKIAYEKAYWERGHVIISGLHLSEDDLDVVVDQLEMEFHFSIKKMFFEPYLKLVHPQIRILTTQSSNNHSANFLGAFFPTNHFCLKVDVQSGVLQVDAQRLYFSFVSKKEREELGTLYVTHDPSLIRDSYLVAEFKMQEKTLSCATTVEQMGLERILQLLTLVQPQLARQWEYVQGQTQLKGKININLSGEIEQLACQFSIQNLSLANPSKKWAASAGSFEGNFYYPADNTEKTDVPWQKMVSVMHLENGEVHFLDAWNLLGLQGKLALDPKEVPLLELTGNLQGSNAPLKFKLEGKGSLHEDESFWLELATRFFDQTEKEAAFHLSLCRPEKQSFVIQSEFKEMFGAQFDFFRTFFIPTFPALEHWKILEGNFHGKCMAKIEKSELSRIEIEYFQGEKVILSGEEKLLPIDKLKLEGVFSHVLPKANGEINLEMLFPASHWTQFFAPESDPVQITHSSHLVSNWKWRKGGMKMTGSLVANEEKDLLQFGFECGPFFPKGWEDIKEGWLHTGALSPLIYTPILQGFSKGFNIQGELDVYGTFDGNELQLSLQANALRAAFPTFYVEAGAIGEKDPTFLKTEGRAKLKIELGRGVFEAKIPLKGAKAYDKDGQFTLHNASGDLLISMDSASKKIQGKFEKAALNLAGEPLLNDIKFALNTDIAMDKIVFEDIGGTVASTESTGPCYFSSNGLYLQEENSTFEGKIVRNGKELVSISAKAPKSILAWNAELKFSKEMPVQGSFETDLFLDPSKSILSFNTHSQTGVFWGNQIQNFALSFKKEGNGWVIDTLRADDLDFKGKGIYENEQIHATQFQCNFKEIHLQGSCRGNIGYQGGDWLLQAEMGFDLATTSPFPMQLHFQPGMKVAFSPSAGLVASDIHFTGENSECALDYLEYLPKLKKWKAQSCRSLIAPQFYGSLLAAKIIPKSLEKIEFSGPIKAIFNLNLEKENLQLLGKVFQGFYWTKEKQDLLFNFERAHRKGKLILQEASHEERVQLDFNVTPEGDFVIEKMNGALGGLILHLKRDEEKRGLLVYTGEMKIDFNALRQFLPQEFKEKIENWKIGNGYQFLGQFVIPPNGYKEVKFFGKICGEEFEALGLKLKTLETKAILSAKEAIFENLVIKDEAGSLSAKKILWNKEGEDRWFFSIPLISIQDFYPHLITKEKNKNLSIKKGTMTNFSGHSTDFSTFQGQGSFHFTGRNRKDFSLFEVPLEMIKNLGIDPGLLTPISGEVDFEFQQGKCVITKLKNVRSEGGRSEFYLPPAPVSSYLDLNGNVYIDLKMKQNVVLNLTEPFTLSIRGTFKEPRYSLR